jgi:hypothetical protein
MNFSEILTFVRQRIKKLPESPFPHTYIYIYIYSYRACVRLNWGAMGRRKTRQVHSVTASRRQTPSNTVTVLV